MEPRPFGALPILALGADVAAAPIGEEERERGGISTHSSRGRPVHCQVVVPDFPVKIYSHLIGECLKIVTNQNRLTGFGGFREFMIEMCEELDGYVVPTAAAARQPNGR